MKKRYGVLVCIALCLILSGCQKQSKEEFPCPIEPKKLVSEMVEETEEAFSLRGLPWGMEKKAAMDLLSEYALVQDDGDLQVYQTDGKLENGTPVRERIQVGYTSEDGTVVGVTVQFYFEENGENWREQTTEQLQKDLEMFEERSKKTTISSGDEVVGVNYEKESGSYIRLNYGELNSDMIRELGLEWEKAGVVGVAFWLPLKKGDLIK